MPKDKLRLSESGKFVGDPGMRVGPSSTGLVTRAHGSISGAVTMNTSTASAVAITWGSATVSTLAIDMQPGYYYNVDLYTEFQGSGMTTSANVNAYYRTRVASTQAWGAWLPITTGHVVSATATTGQAPHGSFMDNSPTVSVSATADAIQFALASDHATGQPAYISNLAWVRVSEYCQS